MTVAGARVAPRRATRAAPPPGVLDGPLRFARYAFGPNRLGLCGPHDWAALQQLGLAGGTSSRPGSPRDEARVREADRGIRELAAGFEGAYPYLRLIAEANGIGDPLDGEVVEAYWLGSRLSDRVDAGLMVRSLSRRFEARMTRTDWRWLEPKPGEGARPTHAFHVFEVFPRMGLLAGGHVADALAVMDACRVRWGRVVGVEADRLVVAAPELEWRAGVLALSEPRIATVRGWLGSSPAAEGLAAGTIVSIHWDWACESLSPARARGLMTRTLAQLDLANRTL